MTATEAISSHLTDGEVPEGEGLVYDRLITGFQDMLIQPDGKLLVLGSVAAGWWAQPVLFRFNADGSRDTSFAADGPTAGSLHLRGELAGRSALQRDPDTGDILVVHPTSSDLITVYRVTAEGQPIEGFDYEGVYVGSTDGVQSVVPFSTVGVAVDEAGGMLIAATQAASYNDPHFMFKRVLPDGSIDPEFRPAEQIDGVLAAFELLADGDLLLAGMRTQEERSVAVLVRLDSRGQPDASWGSDGELELPVEGFKLQAMEVQADGRMVLAGHFVEAVDAQTGEQTLSFGVLRLLPDGELDPSFNPQGATPGVQRGIDGMEVSHWPYPEDSPPLSLSVNAAGQTLLAVPFVAGFKLARLDAAGELDGTFNSAGVIAGVLEIETGSTGWPFLQALLGPSGDVVFGTSMPDPATGSHGFNLMGRLQSDGSLDPGFGLPARALSATNASDVLPASEFGSEIHGYGGVDWVDYEGRLADHRVERNEMGTWQVLPSNGSSQWLGGVERLRFGNDVLALDVDYFDRQGLVVDWNLGSAGMAWALVRMLFGDPAVGDRVLLGQAIAYLDALDLEAVLGILDRDGTLAARMGDPEPSALLQTVYSRFTGEALDEAMVPSLAAEFGYSAPHADRTLAENIADMLASGLLHRLILAETPDGMLAYQSYEDFVVATNGNDAMRASAGGSRLDGAGGTDEVRFDAVRSRFTIERSADDTLIVDSTSHGMSELHHIERVRFADTVLAFDLGPDQAAGQAVRLLTALGGAAGLQAPSNLVGQAIALVDRLSEEGAARTLVANGVTTGLAGGDSLEALIALLHRNLTGTAPAQADLTWSVNWAESQQMDAAELLLFVADLPQTAALIGVEDLAREGLAYQTVYSFG